MAILPSGYQEVEYIQSTATDPGSQESSGQYIDTLVTINKNIKVDIDMQFTSLAVQSRLFGGLYDSGSSGITFSPYINGSTQWARATANGLGNWQSTNVAANTNRNRFVLDNTRYIIYNSSGTQVYNGTNSSTISNSDTWTIPLLASKDRSLNRVNRHSSAKLYGCKIWDNNVLVRDFVPCYRKSDNEIGLYDLVNNQFYSNSGTGSFIKGADILPNWKIQRIYIGDHYQVYPKWTVNSDTVAYYKLESNANDYSGNGKNGTGSNVSYTTKDGVVCAYFAGNTNSLITLPGLGTFSSLSASVWFNFSSSSNGNLFGTGNSGDNANFIMYSGTSSSSVNVSRWNGSSSGSATGTTVCGDGKRHNMIATNGSDGLKVYVDGVLEGTNSEVRSIISQNSYTFIGRWRPANPQAYKGYISNVIIENKVRAAQEVADYYNQTKASYLGFN